MMRAAALSIVILFLTACGVPPSQIDFSRAERKPVGLILKSEISGEQFGYNLREPSGLALDKRNYLYVSDRGNHRIIKFDPDLNPVRDFGGYGSGVGRFIHPEDVIMDRGLNLYVLDSGNRRVVHLDERLNYIEEIIPEDDSSEIIANRGLLSGLALSRLGEMSLVDFDNSRLIRLDNFYRFSRYVGDFGYGSGALLNPVDISYGRDNKYYVADGGNGRIAVFDDYGNFVRSIGEDVLQRPSAVTVSFDNVIWVADSESSMLYAFSSSGTLLFSYSGEDDDFISHDVRGMTISTSDQLFLSDGDNNRILIFDIVYEGE